MDKATMRDTLTQRFDEGELRTLCFDLDVDYDCLPGAGKANKARELVEYFERRGELYQLIRRVRMLRSQVYGHLPPVPEAAQMNGDRAWYEFVVQTLSDIDKRLDTLTVFVVGAVSLSLVTFLLVLVLLISK